MAIHYDHIKFIFYKTRWEWEYSEPPISVRFCTFQENEKLSFSSTIKVYVDIPKTWWLENNETIFD